MGWYTKKTIENYEAANCFLSNLETKSSNIVGFADLYNMQKDIIDKVDYNEIFCNDRFHPNENGYEKISQVLGKIIISNMCWKHCEGSIDNAIKLIVR